MDIKNNLTVVSSREMLTDPQAVTDKPHKAWDGTLPEWKNACFRNFNLLP